MTESVRTRTSRVHAAIVLVLAAIVSGAGGLLLTYPFGAAGLLIIPIIGVVLYCFRSTRMLGVVVTLAPVLTFFVGALDALSQIRN